MSIVEGSRRKFLKKKQFGAFWGVVQYNIVNIM